MAGGSVRRWIWKEWKAAMMNCKCGHGISIHDKGGCQHSDRTNGGIDLVCKCGLSPDAIAEAEITTLRAQLAEAREALEKIANDPDCNISGSDYRIGVADGCRQAAITAKHYLQKVTTA